MKTTSQRPQNARQRTAPRRPQGGISSGLIILGVCMLLGMVAVSAAIYLTSERSRAQTEVAEKTAVISEKAKARQLVEHAKLVKIAADAIAFHYPTTQGATVRISNSWRDWLHRGGDVDSAVSRALDGLQSDGTTDRVKAAARLVRESCQRALQFETRDPDLVAKLVTVQGLFTESVNMSLSPAGSASTYLEAMGKIETDIGRGFGELRALLAARGQ